MLSRQLLSEKINKKDAHYLSDNFGGSFYQSLLLHQTTLQQQFHTDMPPTYFHLTLASSNYPNEFSNK